MNNQLLIKARLSKTEIRRFSVAVPKTFDEFSSSIAAALELDAARLANLRFSWEDEEGDQIALVNNADLSEALRAVTTSDDKLMRLSVRPSREEERKHRHEQREQREQRHAHHGHGGHHGHGRPRHCGGAGHFMGPLAALMQQLQVGLPELLSNPAIRTMAEGLISSNANLVKIDTGRICDNCQGAIVGDRYASTTQDDFDLCSMCMVSDAGAKLQQVHQFRKIAAFEALMQCLANGGGVDAFFATEQGEETEQPKQQQPQRLHHHATCDVCNNTIVGSRFKSLVLDDYDECSACRAKSDKPASDFYEITDVTQRTVPEHVLTARKLQKEAEKAAADAAVEAEKASKKAQEAQEAARVASSRLVAPKVVAVEQPKVIAEAPKKVVEAEAPKPSAPVAAASPSAAVPSAFEQNLQTLESMGFTDRKKAISALVRNRNQLFAAIQSLIE